MARIPDQPLLRGTIGNLIFYSVGGKQYVRSKPARVRQPNSPKQLLARDKFRQSSKLAKALSRACPLLGLDESGNITKSAYHTLLGVLRTSPFGEQRDPVRWVWEELVIRRGKKPNMKLQGDYNKGAGKLEVSWDKKGAPKKSTILLAGIHTKDLTVNISRFPVEAGRGVTEAAPGTAWYACLKSEGVKVRISGSEFIRLIDAEKED